MRVLVRELVCLVCLLLGAGTAYGYTTDETNEVVKALLFGSFIHYDNLTEPLNTNAIVDVRTPEKFFRFPIGGSWSDEEKRAAFDTYLAGMGNRDYTSESNAYYTVTELAISQCEFMHYTNSLPCLKDLIRNTTCSSRVRLQAIHAVIPMLALSDEETLFIESIYTNVNVYSRAERGIASSRYIKRLLSSMTNGQCSVSVMEDAVNRFYRFRKCDSAGSIMFDKLFVSELNGYLNSSNRLDFATYVLDNSGSNEYVIRYFNSITNQLHTSGVGLRWINVGGTNQ